jgi:hypothetical protein
MSSDLKAIAFSPQMIGVVNRPRGQPSYLALESAKAFNLVLRGLRGDGKLFNVGHKAHPYFEEGLIVKPQCQDVLALLTKIINRNAIVF